jgi:HEAT repeat protein
MPADHPDPSGGYQTAEIRIFDPSAQGQGYPVELKMLGGPGFRGTLQLDVTDLMQLTADPHAYGRALGEALFADEALGGAYRQTIAAAQGRLRVRLQIDPPELQAIHWERIYHPLGEEWHPLGSTASTPFSRFVPTQQWDRPTPVAQRPIRILAVIASPGNLDSYSLDPISGAERQALHHTLDGLADVAVTYLETGTANPATLRLLRRVLAEGFHLAHFLCHGAVTQAGTVLYLEDDAGTVAPILADRLVRSFRLLAAPPLLCFLAACESAARQRSDAFVPLGPALITEGGVQTVVAMGDRVGMETARLLVDQFYTRLLEHDLVDVALNEARAYIQDQWDWGVPVLFSRLPENRLFTTDPVRTALQAIRHWQLDEYLPMPIEVLHRVRQQHTEGLEWPEVEFSLSRDLIDVTRSIFADRSERGRSGKLVVLVGGHGSARSTQIRNIARITAERSLTPGADREIVPVFVDLSNYPAVQSGPQSRIEVLMLESLRSFWPELTASKLSDLLRDEDGPILRILLDGSDDLPDRQRREAWREVQALADNQPRHDYMLAIDPDSLDLRRLRSASDLLIIQPLTQEKVEQFLKNLDDPVAERLYRELEKHQLFDLAASPWLVVKMLSQARQGVYPGSRKQVLRNLVDDAIAEVPAERGMRTHAELTLNRLAWEMQSSRSSTWTVRDALATMAAVRGNREYSLEVLFDELVQCDLLARVGQENMRFAFPAIQSYCCARAISQMDDRDHILDDVTASLGRLSRLRWWEDTLVLLSGLMNNPNVLLRFIVYGSNLSEGEQIFLAVRCIMEADQQKVDVGLIELVIDGLAWRLDSTVEPRSSHRARAVQALGQLRHPSAIPDLARVANQHVRTNWRGELTYDHSIVRMAAIAALQGLMPRYEKKISAADPQLAGLLRHWLDGDVDALKLQVKGEDEGAQATAAFALGYLQTDEAVDFLIKEVFLHPDTPAATRWAATDALVMLDPALVTQRAILPLLDKDTAQREGLDPAAWRYRASWYERLAYLIGKVRTLNETALGFLEDCLKTFAKTDSKAKAIQSFGWLNDRSKKALFEEIALGNFAEIESDLRLSARITDWQERYLRRKAIEALAYIGDADTVTRLRSSRSDWHPELQRAFYQTSEEIAWRTGMWAEEPSVRRTSAAWPGLAQRLPQDRLVF